VPNGSFVPSLRRWADKIKGLERVHMPSIPVRQRSATQAMCTTAPLLIVISLRCNVYPRALDIAAPTLPADALALSARHTFHHRPRIPKQRPLETHKSITQKRC
jgi:hypothetical protein